MVHRFDKKAMTNVWVDDDGRWGKKAVRVAHPGCVEYIERLVDEGRLHEAFARIRDPSLFYSATTEFFNDPATAEDYAAKGIPLPPPWRAADCPEAPGPLTDAETRHLTAYALRRAAEVHILIDRQGYWVDRGEPEGTYSNILARVQGLPLTAEIVELIVAQINPPGSLKGETQPNLALKAAIARADERNPKISTRALAKRLKVPESTVRRNRRAK